MPELMKLDLRREHQVYKNKDGKRVPGVTTVLSALAKPELLRWYASMERDALLRGDTLPEPNKEGKPVYFAEVKRDRAADLGTTVHARIEAWLRGTELDPEGLGDLYEQSIHGFDRFRRWWDGQGFTLAGSEVQMVSEEMQVGGTLDVAATRKTFDGGIAVVDIKSSKSSPWWPYKENKAQPQTYGNIWTEVNKQPVHEVWVYRCGTTPEDTGQEYRLMDHERQAATFLFAGALMAYRAARALEA